MTDPRTARPGFLGARRRKARGCEGTYLTALRADAADRGLAEHYGEAWDRRVRGG